MTSKGYANETAVYAHYFARTDWQGDPIMRNGEPVVKGMYHAPVTEEIRPCYHGYHGSRRIIDALMLAYGQVYCPRRLSGTVVWGNDKLAASHCETLGVFDLGGLLHEFTCRLAEYYIDNFEVTRPERARQLVGLKRSWLGGFIPYQLFEWEVGWDCPTVLKSLKSRNPHVSAQRLFGDMEFDITLGYEDESDPECRELLARLDEAAEGILTALFEEHGIPNYVRNGDKHDAR